MIGLPNGVYVLEFSTEPNTSVSRVFYYVTNLRVMAISKQQDHMRYIVVDAITGQPVKGAKVKVAGTNARAKENHVTLTTNEARRGELCSPERLYPPYHLCLYQ